MRRYLLTMLALLVIAVGCSKDGATGTSESGGKDSAAGTPNLAAAAAKYDTSTPAKLYAALHESFNATDAEGMIALMSKDMRGMMLKEVSKLHGKMIADPEAIARFKQMATTDKDPLSLKPEELLVLMMRMAFTIPERKASFSYDMGDTYIGTVTVDGGAIILAEGPKYRSEKKGSIIQRRRVELPVVKEAGGWRSNEGKISKLKGKPDRTFETGTISHMSLAFSADGALLAQCTDLGLCKIWNTATGKLVRQHEFYAGRVNLPVVFNSDLSLAALVTSNGMLNIWDTTTGKQVGRIGSSEDRGRPLAFSPDGKLLATTSSKTDGRVVLWSTDSWWEAYRLQAHMEPITAIAFSPDGKRLATAADDKLIKIWDRSSWERLFSIATSTRVAGLTFSDDGKRLASVSASWHNEGVEHEIVLWETAGGKPLFRVTDYDSVRRVALVPNSERIVAISWKSVTLIDPTDGMELRQISFRESSGTFGYESVACSPDGQYVAAVGALPKDEQGDDGPVDTKPPDVPASAATRDYIPEERKEPAPVDPAVLGRELVEQDDRPKDGLIFIWKMDRTPSD
jgi:hypothetical protein